MDAACMIASNYHHIPPEIIEEILCNLAVKSLVRFRSVSKSWNSRISRSRFIRKHLRRAALKRLVVADYIGRRNGLSSASWCPLSSILNQPTIEDAIELICPIPGYENFDVRLVAVCEGLWCVAIRNSLFLWNPSLRIYRKILDRLYRCPSSHTADVFGMGMGYDSIRDDYKVFKISFDYKNRGRKTEVYSLRYDSWRKIDQPFPENYCPDGIGEFVNGALHWMVHPHRSCCDSSRIIVSFDLSTEKYGEVPQPEYTPTRGGHKVDRAGLTVLRGMLCVFLRYNINISPTASFVLWAMKDYRVQESWTKILHIGCNSTISSVVRSAHAFSPVYLFENGELLIKVLDGLSSSKLVLYKNEETTAQVIVVHGREVVPGFVHVESLVSFTGNVF